MLNLSVLLEDSARRYPSRDAFIFMDTHLTYAQINGAANQAVSFTPLTQPTNLRVKRRRRDGTR